ncbi:hypothetical protein MHB65_13365 [Lysinibacillus sp. FSL K6-0075]
MIDEKVHLKCGYIYVKKEKTGTLIFWKVSKNFIHPNVNASSN